MTFKRPMPHIHGAQSGYDIDKYKYEYISLQEQGWNAIAIASDLGSDIAVEDSIISSGDQNPSFGEITDSGVTGLKIDAAGDLIALMWPIPYDLDIESDINFAVQWSSGEATTTDTLTWKIVYKELTLNSTAIDIPGTALDTAIVADYNVAALHAIQQCPWGTITRGTLTNGNVLLVNVELQAVSGPSMGSDVIAAYNLVIRYVRRAL